VSPRVAALQGLTRERVPLVVDDFHDLPRDLQGSIVRALKQPIFDGCRNYRHYSCFTPLHIFGRVWSASSMKIFAQRSGMSQSRRSHNFMRSRVS
jgi:hypothetical protein